MTLPSLSVVVPSYNGRHWLEPCLASLFRHRRSGIDLEVIVVDDASTDGTAEWIRETHPAVRVVLRAVNGGFCDAANAGIAAARGAVIQLLNNDAEVSDGWAEAGLGPFADPSVGSVAPLVLVRSDPSRVDSAGDSYSLLGWPSKRGHGRPASEWERRPPGPVFGASGSSAFYRASAIRLVGGFDPSFGSYYEDVDLAFRLRWAGYGCVFEPRCRILHEVSASYDHARPDLQRRMSRNAEVVFWSDLPLTWMVAATVPHLAFTMVQAAWRLARGRLRPFALGKLDAIRSARLIAGRRRGLPRPPSGRPRFPVTIAPVADLRNHLRRPGEASARLARETIASS